MTDIIPFVTIEHNVPLADSRIIAEKLDIDHQNFYAQIKKYQDEVETDFGVILFKTDKPTSGSSGGRPEQYAMLTETQANVYMAYSQNTDQARACKRLLVKAFDEAKQYIRKLEQVIQLQNAEDHKALPVHLVDIVESHIQQMADYENETQSLIDAAKKAKRLTYDQASELTAQINRNRRATQHALKLIEAHEEALIEFDSKLIAIFSGQSLK